VCGRVRRSNPQRRDAKTLGIGTFTQALCDEPKKGGWTVVSMKNDWKLNFPFE
jgi:hypothetical protein